jgi:hypothetical protein
VPKNVDVRHSGHVYGWDGIITRVSDLRARSIPSTQGF